MKYLLSDFRALGARANDGWERSCSRRLGGRCERAGAPRRQFCAPPKPLIASVMSAGFSTICEKRTTVTVSSIETSRP